MKNLKSPEWVGKAKKASTSKQLERNLENELKPYIVFITNTLSEAIDGSKIGSEYGADVVQEVWSSDGDGFKVSIPFSKHKKGFVFRKLTSSETGPLVFPDGDELSSGAPQNLIIPRVKTYSQILEGGLGTSKYEETYDSAQIDINSGEVTVYSNVNTPAYLVLIY